MHTRDEASPHGQYPTRHERVVDFWVHIIGIGLAVVGGVALVGVACLNDGLGRAVPVSVYAPCLLTVLTVSAASNLAYVIHPHRQLQNADEAAIFLLIAGSYAFHHADSARSLAIGFKLFVSGISRRLWMVAYLLLGWMVTIAIGPLVKGLHTLPLMFLVGGGVTYTIGTISYAALKLCYRRAVWHGFVLAAAAMHFVAILSDVVLT